MDEDNIKYIYTDTYVCTCVRGKERARERRANGKRIAREPKGCERVAGFPGFVVMTTKPLLPDQTEIRADGNAYTNAQRERVRRKDAEGRKKPGVRTRADGEREMARRESETEIRLPLESYPRASCSFNRPVLPPSLSPSPQIVPQPPLSGRRLLHQASRASDSQPSREINRRIECFDPLSTEFVAPLPVILHRESLVKIACFQHLVKCGCLILLNQHFHSSRRNLKSNKYISKH